MKHGAFSSFSEEKKSVDESAESIKGCQQNINSIQCPSDFSHGEIVQDHVLVCDTFIANLLSEDYEVLVMHVMLIFKNK